MSKFKFLIISDMHIGKPGEENLSTRLTTDTPDIPTHDNPFESLKEFIGKRNMSFDGIINLGDLTNKGLVSGFMTGMRMMRELSLMMNCPLLCIPGNHDYCYTFSDGPNRLFKRTINYPTNNEESNSHFWSKGYCFYHIGDVLFLICNSGKDLRTLEDNGKTPRFDSTYIDGLKEDVIALQHQGPKIAIVHHHVLQHSDIVGEYDSNDTIDRADSFLEVMRETGFNCILHGHKHISRYIEHGNMAIMACGSLSALENLRICDEPNYFHVVTIEYDNQQVRGKVESYYFKIKKGWLDIVDDNFSLKPRYAFGYNVDLKSLAFKLKEYIQPNAPVLNIEDVKDECPEIDYLSGSEEEQLSVELSNLGFKYYPSANGGIIYKV